MQPLENNGLVQERHNSTVNALELRLSCTNPAKYSGLKRGNIKSSTGDERLECTNRDYTLSMA